MMNLFSSFNPITSSHSSLNWMMLTIPTMFITSAYWKMPSMMEQTYNMFMDTINKQFEPSMKKMDKPNKSMVVALMIMIFMYNATSLIPNTFSVTTHIMINLSMALVIWTTLLMKKMNNPLTLMSKLTPSSTPTMLIPFMVMIELISMMIQPMTLSIRLTANITAGHIMMILISQMYQIIVIPTLIMNLMMMMLEMGVALIQAYVFSMLIIMYSK